MHRSNISNLCNIKSSSAHFYFENLYYRGKYKDVDSMYSSIIQKMLYFPL